MKGMRTWDWRQILGEEARGAGVAPYPRERQSALAGEVLQKPTETSTTGPPLIIDRTRRAKAR